MEIRQVEDLIFEHFPFEATKGQRILILALAEFILNHNKQEAFLFKGYAGTGKTTILSALVKAAPALRMKTVLLAPPAGRQRYWLHTPANKPLPSTKKFTCQKLPAMDRFICSAWKICIPTPYLLLTKLQ